MKCKIKQTTAIETVAKSLPKNEVILLNRLISNSYIPYRFTQNVCRDAYLRLIVVGGGCGRGGGDVPWRVSM